MAAATTVAPLVAGIGARQVRLEDEALLTGRAKYTADLAEHGATHAVFVRSPYAHARIVSIDPSAALALPGVVAVLTHADITNPQVFFPGFAALFTSDAYHRRPLATDVARFVGEIVAIVIAETLAIAEDAVDLVDVDYDPLPVVIDPLEAAADEAPLLFPEAGTNVAVNVPYTFGEPSPDGIVTVRQVVSNQRMAVVPMEGSAILAVPEPSGRITAYMSTQMPHLIRMLTAMYLGIDQSELHVVTPAVGGGFGGKVPADPDYVAIIAAARQVGRPVRWVQSRRENLLTMQARGHRFDVALRATPEGKVTSVEVDALTDAGAYPGVGCGMVLTTRTLATGPYDIPHLRFDVRCVATNTSPVGPFRGAGRPEAAGMLERAMDCLAAELGLDPVELRRRNLIRADQFPYESAAGMEYDSGDYEALLDVALATADYDALRAEQASRRADGSRIHLGIGVSTYVEVSAGSEGFNAEWASVEVSPNGRARIVAGTQSHGQAHHTTYSQIVTSTLGIPVDKIDFLDGDTDLVKQGMGTGGSRSAQVGGTAVKLAADEVLEKARQIAAHVLEAEPSDIDVVRGGLAVRGVPARTVTWSMLAEIADDPSRRPADMEPGLQADPGFVQTIKGTSPYGCHIAVVEVDEDTGGVRLIRMIAADDCGVMINPMLVEGQVHGGLLGGIAQALFEECRFDADGNPLASTLAEYAMPSAAEVPSYELAHTVTPTPNNPLGVKGVGEAGTTGSLAAVHNAVVDAVTHLGIRHIELPLSPERVWTAIQQAR
jgi:carbon-monoxide dehydrogenase large subunit